MGTFQAKLPTNSEFSQLNAKVYNCCTHMGTEDNVFSLDPSREFIQNYFKTSLKLMFSVVLFLFFFNLHIYSNFMQLHGYFKGNREC